MEDGASPAAPATPTVHHASDVAALKPPTPSPTMQHGFPAASPSGSRASLSGASRFPAANPAEFVALVTAALGALPQHELTDSEAIHRALSSHLSLDARRAAPLHAPSETLMSLADALSRRISALKASIDGDGTARRSARPPVASEPANPAPTPTRLLHDSPSFSVSHDTLDLCVRVPTLGRRVRVDMTPLHSTLHFDVSAVDSGAETPMESNCFSDDLPSGQLVPCSTQSSSANGSPCFGALPAQLGQVSVPRASQPLLAPHATPCRQSRTFVEELDCRGVPSPAELEAALQQIARNALAGRLTASDTGELAGPSAAAAESFGRQDKGAVADEMHGPPVAVDCAAPRLAAQLDNFGVSRSTQDRDLAPARTSLPGPWPAANLEGPRPSYHATDAASTLAAAPGRCGQAPASGRCSPQSCPGREPTLLSLPDSISGAPPQAACAACVTGLQNSPRPAPTVGAPLARRMSCPAARAAVSSPEWTAAKYVALRAVGRTRRWSIADSSICAPKSRRCGDRPSRPCCHGQQPWPQRRSAECIEFHECADVLSEPAAAGAGSTAGEAARCFGKLARSSSQPAVAAMTDGGTAAAALFVQDGLIGREHVLEGWNAVEQHVAWVATGLRNMLRATERVNGEARVELIASQAALFAAKERKAAAEASLAAQTHQTDQAAQEAQSARRQVDEISAHISSVQSALNLARTGVQEARVTFHAKQEMVSQLQEEWSKQSAMRSSPAGTITTASLSCKTAAIALDDLLPSSTPTNKIPAGPVLPTVWAGCEPAEVDPAISRLWDAPNVFAEYVAAPHTPETPSGAAPMTSSAQVEDPTAAEKGSCGVDGVEFDKTAASPVY